MLPERLNWTAAYAYRAIAITQTQTVRKLPEEMVASNDKAEPPKELTKRTLPIYNLGQSLMIA